MIKLIFNKYMDILKKDYLFYGTSLLLLLIILSVQIKIWTGESSFFGLKELKEEVVTLEDKKTSILRANKMLDAEKIKLSSGRDAIEGLARSELGLIKPGESFYIFSDQKSDPKQ